MFNLFKTVDSVLAQFNKNIEDLAELADEHEQSASKYQALADQHHVQSERADRIRAKITDLIS